MIKFVCGTRVYLKEWKEGKGKDTALDFTVPTGDVDLRFLIMIIDLKLTAQSNVRIVE